MRKFLKHTWAFACVTAAVSAFLTTPNCYSQSGSTQYQSGSAAVPFASGGQNGETLVDASVDNIELVTGSSRRLKFEYKIPELLVENPEIIRATPIGPREVLISGLKPGISTVSVSDASKNVQLVTIHVTADTRKLKAAIRKFFPDSSIRVDALQTGIVLSGQVAMADHIQQVTAIAQDYFPTNVINRLQVDGSQLVAIKVKVYEVSRTKLRRLGIDWAIDGDDFAIGSSISGLIQEIGIGSRTVTGAGQTLTFGVLGDRTDFTSFIEALEQNNLAKLLDQPVLTAQHGRPAEFLSGGEIPIQIAAGLGTNSVEFRAFGTKLDIVPLIHGGGELTLEVRAEVSEVAPELSGDTGVPGFRVRRVNTGVRMKAGHTLALAGDYRESASANKRGIPKLMDSSIWGPLFRRVEDQFTETELVFLITPQFINEVDPTAVPRLGPGQLTVPPSSNEMYWRGYQEVPRCNDGCPTTDAFDGPVAGANVGQGVGYSSYNPGIMQSQPIQQMGNGFANPVQQAIPQGQLPVQQQVPGQLQGPVAPAGGSGIRGAGFSWPSGNGG